MRVSVSAYGYPAVLNRPKRRAIPTKMRIALARYERPGERNNRRPAPNVTSTLLQVRNMDGFPLDICSHRIALR